MTLKLSNSALSQIANILSDPGNSQRYAAAYAVVNADIAQTYGGLSLSSNDQDVVHWLGIAEQVNSRAQSLAAILIRANNSVAVALELWQKIDLFGPQQQEALFKLKIERYFRFL